MLRWLWISILIIFSDQLTKWIAEASLEVGVPHPVISHLNMTLSYNMGAAFSFLSNQGGWQRWFFAIIAIAVCIMILVWMKKLKDNEVWAAIGLSLVLGGAIGNLVDRILTGKVIDFIDMYYAGYHFAIFNVADIAISVGAAILVIISLFTKEDEEPAKT